MMKYQLSHLTEYRYQHPIANSYNLACLTPRILPWQNIEQFRLQVTPAPSEIQQWQDRFGNTRHFIHLQPPHECLSVFARYQVILNPRPDVTAETRWQQLPQRLLQQYSQSALEARLCTGSSKMIPLLPQARELMLSLLTPELTVTEAAHKLMTYIYSEFLFDPGFSSVITPVATVLEHKRGVCQDFAQAAICCLRSVGIPARYVSGYLETRPPAGQARLVGADASHAWFAVYDPVAGWTDFDPTNNQLPGEQYITLAYGRDYADVVPLKGLLQGNGQHQLRVAVDVIPSE